MSKTTAVVGVIFAILGLLIGGGGIWLTSVGGSPYYIVAGIAFIGTGALLIQRRPAALALYALFVVGTLIWALWEVGFDWWPLAARGGLIIVLGALLLLPFITRRLGVASVADAMDHRRVHPTATSGTGLALTVSLLLAVAVAAVSWFTDLHRIEGEVRSAGGAAPNERGVPEGEWHAYGRTSDAQRYAPLTQITPDNVSGLEVAWEYNTGDISRPGDPEETTFQATPLKIGDRLYLCTPHQSVIALDAVSGKEIWRYDPQIRGELALQHLTCRGLSYQAPGIERTTQPVALADAAAAAAPAEAPAAPPAPAATPEGQPAAAPTTPAPEAAPAPAAEAEPTTVQPAGSMMTQGMAEASGEGATPSTFSEEETAEGTQPPQEGIVQAGRDQSASFTALSAADQATGTPEQPVANLPQAAQSAQRTTPSCTNGKLFMPTADGRLIALNPDDGSVCADFGGGDGQIDLWANMPYVNVGSYYSTSPVVVTANLVIVGGTVLDNVSTTEPSGVIRAFDVDTGALVWNWDSGNPDDTAPLAPGQTYTPNSPNSWSISSADEDLGLVYVPLGNQPPDQWGGNRSENVERFSSSVVALNLADGTVNWNFQTVHHDLWDYDVPSQPTLVDLTIGGESVPALVQPTKQGEIYVLDRRTGEPILPVTETPAPQGAARGDFTAPTQPVSALSFDPPALREKDMWGATLIDQLACRIAFHSYYYEGRFTPPSEMGSLIYPGNFGVFNWGSVAVDPVRQIAFTTPAYLAFTSKLIPRDNETDLVVNDQPPQGALPALNENFGAPYAAEMGPFTSVLGLPCQSPPWGYVAAADLTTGEIVWMHKNGTVRDASPLPLPFRMGVPSLGGPLMTESGVAFLSGTIDYYVRAYDVTTGEEIWRDRLPAGGQATPMSYTGADGRQYVVVVAGGHGSLGTKRGDSVIAYALPQ
ncbi:PQQ-binding-like beta-propeller repeat protein [Aureimonas mangrovi]|uniref:outer membrane protein assembly factor BamB family protein n=1 Tax=Aureimonas mangrovi TaxID=2758041 RepID=UPI00163DB5A8|nr:PQQ-binding-like beta-propeller repeat protein [Aureimonas mangrovi]